MDDVFQIFSLSILGIEEGEKAISKVTKELMELLLSIKFVALIECSVVITNMFP
jgi:hypothetical protein